jgi:hypothetical protein
MIRITKTKISPICVTRHCSTPHDKNALFVCTGLNNRPLLKYYHPIPWRVFDLTTQTQLQGDQMKL